MISRHVTLAVAAGTMLAATATAQTPAPVSFAVPIAVPDAPPAVTVPYMRYAVSFARPYEAPFAPTVIHLRNTAASDVGSAVRKYVVASGTGRTAFDFYMGYGLGTAVGVDAASSALFATPPRCVVRVEGFAPAPPQCVVRAEFVLVPPGFCDDAGLGAGTKWALSPREAKLLAAATRHAPGREVLAAPTLTLADNQTGTFRADGSESRGLESRITPRMTPDGKITLRFEVRLTEADGETRNVRTVETTMDLPPGGTLVVRGPRTQTTDGDPADLLAVVTVTGAGSQSK